MLGLYRAITGLVYFGLWPVGKLKVASGNNLWKGRMARLDDVGQADIWLHAASMGEVRVIGYLVDFLLEKKLEFKIHVTVITKTGFQAAQGNFGDRVVVSFFPFDAVPTMRRFINAVRPKIIVIAETEIWPNLIVTAKASDVPIVLINGRMTEKSFGRYKLVKKSISRLLSGYDRLYCKTEGDKKRYRFFDVPEDRFVVAGDMKFDAPLYLKTAEEKKQIRVKLKIDENAFMLVAGSTRPGEEAFLLGAYKSLKVKHPSLRLIIAPRHLDRLNEIKTHCASQAISYYIYNGEKIMDSSDSHIDSESADPAAVVLVDVMGQLNDLYAAGDLAFVGGTLVDIGGHNILEPVWAQTPVIYGPYLSNVREAADYIKANNFGMQVNSEVELEITLNQILSGKKTFKIKTQTDFENSPTARAGQYILERIGRD